MKRLRISKVRDLSFGRHIKRSFDGLESQFVVIHGANESGKSTLAEFLTWAVGGPWRSNKDGSEIFRIKSDDFVYGTVFASLGTDRLELQARFKLKGRGQPDDKRQGILAGRNLNTSAVKDSLGGINAEDFQLIYRLYGGSLGNIGSGAEFSNLFSSFAMGSTNPSANPRLALDDVEKARKSLETSSNEKNEVLREIDEKIRVAKKAPEEIEKLEVEIQGLSESNRISLGRIDQLIEERELLRGLISNQLHINEKKTAEGKIKSLPSISSAMKLAAANLSDLERLTDDKRLAESAARDARGAAERAIAECGLKESMIRDRTLSPIERNEVAGAARRYSEATKQSREADLAAKVADDARKDKEIEVERDCSRIGLQEPKLTHLDAILIDLPSLSDRAGRWVEQVNAAIEDESKSATTEKALDFGIGANKRRGLPPSVIAAGFVLVALAGFAHQILGLAVAAALAAIALFFRASKRRLNLGGRNEPDNDSDAANWARDAESHRKQAKSHHELLLEGLGALADLIEGPDTARDRIHLLTTIAEMRRKLVELSADLQSKQSLASEAATALVSATQNAEKILGARDIPLSLVDQNFETWLVKYESAILALSSSVSAQNHVNKLQENISVLLKPLTDEVAGLEPKAVIERVQEAHDVEKQLKAALQRIREAESAISAANLNSPAAKKLLDQYDDESKLESRLKIVSSELTTAQNDRDGKVAEHGAKVIQKDGLLGTEVLPGLNLEKGQCEETIEEINNQLAAATVAHKVLQETIDRYERENQDPVVATASELINEIVPDWGQVMFTRDAKKDPVLERADNDGRLNEKFLSDGARALLYLGIRLAFAQKDAEKRGIALPLICDDPLLHFDDKRSLSALQLLSKFSKNHQVLLFTCDKGSRDAAAKIGASVVEI